MTDVFLLDTRDPSRLSFVKNLEGRLDTIKHSLRLEMSVKRLSAFKISHINPLRYNYYINNQLVTTFTDANPVTVATAAFTNGTFLPVNDISSIQLLGIGADNVNQKAQLISSQNEINAALSALQKLKRSEKGLTEQYANLLDKQILKKLPSKKDTLALQIDKMRQQIDELENNIAERTDSLSQKVSNYQTAIATMNINNRNQAILQDISKRYNGSGKNSYFFENDPNSLEAMSNKIGSQAASYLQLTNELDSAELLYNILSQTIPTVKSNASRYLKADTSRGSFDLSQRYVLKQLLQKLADIGYSSQYLSNIEKNNQYDNIYFLIEGFRLKEFITSKKFNELDAFILTTCEELARLLQNNYVEFSRDLNSVKDVDYISDDNLEDIRKWADDITGLFSFIQDLSSDFIVLTKYLSIDNTNYKEILTSITTYYVQLLSFLKNFDYIKQANTTVDFTLPTSTNLSNVDLVRYNVERDDKVTNGKQSYTYDIWIRGGIKVDFSAGIFCSGLVDNAYNKIQLLRSDSNVVTGDTFAIKKQDLGNFNFAFGGMVNVYPRLGASWLTVGGSVGVAYSNNQKLQVLAAGSIHLGKTERLILHGGFAMGTVKTLDISSFPNTYDGKNNQYIVRGDITSFNIPLVEKFVAKPFIGLTYNLSKKNALMAVSEPGLDKYNSALQPATPK